MRHRRRHGDRSIWRRGLLALTLTILVPAIGAAQLIDRVLAVVGGEPITLSDLTAAVRLGLVPAPATTTEGTDPALEALIDRRLQLIEVNRYLPPDPTVGEMEARLAEVRSRFPSDAAFKAALDETGTTEAQLRAQVRDSLRIESYLQQRFSAAYQPGEDEILRYYRVNSGEFVRDGKVQPYPDVRDEARRRLVQSRSAQLVREWLAGLRRRADVNILPKGY